MRILTCLVDQHDPFLVGLAALICVVGSVVALRLYGRTRTSLGQARAAWLFMGAVAGGATIWCTHFVAMLAYEPGVETTYAPALTGLSLLVAMLGCALSLRLGAGRFRHAPEAGGALFGLTVAAMHYSGMAAFTAEATVFWSPIYIAASIAAAVVGGVTAFRLAAGPRRQAVLTGPLALVATIVALHFTGMAALTVLPLAPRAGDLTGHDAAALLAVGVAAVAFLLLGTAVASHVLERQTVRLSQDRLASLIEGSVDGMLVERGGRILIANAAFGDLCGLDQAALVGSEVERWIEAAAAMTGGALAQSRLTPVAGEAEAVPVEVAVRRVDGAGDGREARVLAVRDLRPRLAQESRIRHLARHDDLTGLPNRAAFLEALDQRIAAGPPGRKFAVLAIDLNRFKDVNDQYGQAIGDRMLAHVAERMTAGMTPGDVLARLGGDEFMAIAPIGDRVEAMEASERLRAAIVAPMQVGVDEIQCGASIGIAVYPDDAADASTLINNADLAMYRAKASPTADICFYEGAMDEAVRMRRRITQGLREALESDGLELHYQPQASVGTGAVTGYEALLRWPQPDGSFISPADFIPIAEAGGLIVPIGEWVLRRACAEAAAWPAPHRVAVNLSPVQLSHVDLPRLVHSVLLETGLSPSRLELEITETAMIADLERTTHVLRQLKLLGVSVAMDDFGTGYSSLSTLRAFPFDKIKLDRLFMAELDSSPQSRAIIRAVLALGESLDIPVLAEGVETAGQLSFLRELGCDEAQGFLLGRPSRDAVTGGQPSALAAVLTRAA